MAQRYNTGNARPSNSMKDLSDNAQAYDDFMNSDGDNAVDRFGKEFPTISKLIKNVDEIFSSQLSTQESTFSESQTDKENRFQQFLLSSGYQFLGDYENGPYVFSELNQYIEYSGNSYRIASASDIGFTTTGTDATSFANDVTHFVLMNGDTLRQNLSSINLPGTSLVIGADGASVDQAIKFVTPLLKPGIENAEYNYTVIQAAANKNRHLDLPKYGDV